MQVLVEFSKLFLGYERLEREGPRARGYEYGDELASALYRHRFDAEHLAFYHRSGLRAHESGKLPVRHRLVIEIRSHEDHLASRVLEGRLILFSAAAPAAALSAAVTAVLCMARDLYARIRIIDPHLLYGRYPGSYPFFHDAFGFFRHQKIELGVYGKRHARSPAGLRHRDIGDLDVDVLLLFAAGFYKLIGRQNVFGYLYHSDRSFMILN